MAGSADTPGFGQGHFLVDLESVDAGLRRGARAEVECGAHGGTELCRLRQTTPDGKLTLDDLLFTNKELNVIIVSCSTAEHAAPQDEQLGTSV